MNKDEIEILTFVEEMSRNSASTQGMASWMKELIDKTIGSVTLERMQADAEVAEMQIKARELEEKERRKAAETAEMEQLPGFGLF